jgi:hypothetical protein
MPVAVILEQPQCITGKPVGLISIEDHCRIIADPESGCHFFEFFRSEKVATQGMLQGGEPVDLDRARDVTDRVEQRIFIRFDDADVWVIQVGRNPFRIHKVVRMSVRHLISLSIIRFCITVFSAF